MGSVQARSIEQLAVNAASYYSFDNLNSGLYRLWGVQGWKEFVNLKGGIYHQHVEIPFPDIPVFMNNISPDNYRQACGIELPYDIRTFSDNGILLGATAKPVTISDNGTSMTITSTNADDSFNLNPNHTRFMLKIGLTSDIVDLISYTFIIPTATTRVLGFDTITDLAFPVGYVNPGFSDTTAYIVPVNGHSILRKTTMEEITSMWQSVWNVASTITFSGYYGITGNLVGRPDSYAIDGRTLYLNRVPDGNDICLSIDYDAEVPADFLVTDPLPAPSSIEECIIGYMLMNAGKYKNDKGVFEMGQIMYNKGLELSFRADALLRIGA